ncbi:NUDIX hydrolase [Bradyrhizobium amphicarpaeae]|uniref:GDP-mannose pyrophosphatase n=1 Tax=Bradyrhizobium amphicarpaeae TaxID=1404768 RepID=A0A2U8PU25_9BRAD|nr:NUDIX hydrolase [Bradyrhizobium amphicarpaeae]AWM01212.1 NUDIX hydrolase [Bradyrhizobium amphicarpaeae]
MSEVEPIVAIKGSDRLSPNSVNIQKGTTYVFPDSACIAALDVDGALILVEQLRRTIAQSTLELPGGTLRTGESPLECAQREFGEETGLGLCDTRFLFKLDLDLSTTIHRTHVFEARAVGRPSALKGEFKVRHVPVEEAIEMVRAGVITHAPTVSAVLSITAKY